jgi:hypothetical protein
MQWRLVHATSFIVRSKLIAASFLLAGNLLLAPGVATAGITVGPLTATQTFGDDVHTSVASALTAIAGANGNTVNQSGGYINVGDAAFAAANPASGTGLSGQGWTFNWAAGATQTAVQGTMNGTYYAWVVSAPTNVAAGGSTYNDPTSPGFLARYGATNMNEVGGALFNITANYAIPANTPTDTYSLHWIQARTSSYNTGVNNPAGLDNPFAAGLAPFYDAGGAAGTVAGNPNAWFLDIPNAFENEIETNPVATATFQMVLALDDQTTDGKGIVQNAVTLLGGYQWGYTYTAVEVPEPSTVLQLVCGFAGAGGFLLRKRNRSRFAVRSPGK